MTSLSRRNRRTTLRRTIRKATAISLAWLGWANTATAQNPATPLNKPIASNWTPHPATPIAQTPAKPVEVPQAAPIGTRVLTPNQPNTGVVRVQDPPPKAPDPKPSTTYITPADQANVFRLSNDAEFNNRMLTELNTEYMKKWEKDGMRPEQKPKLLTAADLPESLGVPPQSTGMQSRLDPTPLWVKVEPSFVVHRRLMFEDKNSERYGWELGIAQPAISAAYFAKDVFLWPSHLASSLFERYDTSAGKCPPGSPVPYLLYPPEITAFGGTVGAAVIVGTAFLIP